MGEEYKCSKCGATNVKLWRLYQSSSPNLLCGICAAENQHKYIFDIDKKGQHTTFFDMCPPESTKIIMSRQFHRAFTRGKIPRKLKKRMQKLHFYIDQYKDSIYQGYKLHVEKTNTIGWYVPAIEVDGMSEAYWGYTSVPEAAVWLWDALPTLPQNKAVKI